MDDDFNISEDARKGKYLTFSLHSEVYGIDINRVTEIAGMQPINQVPEVVESVKGIINLRGKIIPVIDMRLKFNLVEKVYDERTCIIVIEVSAVTLGLIVDQVVEVIELSDEQICEPPQLGGSISRRYIQGIGKSNEQLILLIDCDKLSI